MLFNKDRKFDGRTQVYPLFFGEQMGLHDLVDTTYPILEELAMTQRAQYWVETEIDLSKDILQWKSLDKNTQDVSILNLSWQSLGDTIAGRAPLLSIMPFVTNPEFEELLNFWQFFENIHSRAYQHIIRTVFPDPERVRDAVASNDQAIGRLNIVIREFESLHKLSAQYVLDMYDGDAFKTHKKEVYQLALGRALAAIYALESVQFFASFACTFALAERKVMSGVADELKLIAKDESLHTRFTHALLTILGDDSSWSGVNDEIIEFFHEVMEETIQLEYKWADYLFSEGRSILGLNPTLLKEYVDYLRTGAVTALGLSNDRYGSEVKQNPLPWVDKYLNPEMVQVAPQERNITNYRVGASDGEVGELGNFDFDEF